MKIELELRMVTMPNHIIIEGGTPVNSIPVQNLSFEEASKYAEQMRLDFIQHWKNKGGKVS